jgi:hypothetical protein
MTLTCAPKTRPDFKLFSGIILVHFLEAGMSPDALHGSGQPLENGSPGYCPPTPEARPIEEHKMTEL